MYQSELGRFFAQDRFAEKYYGLSSYQYGANNPILFIDVNGDSLTISGAGVGQALDYWNEGMGGYYQADVDQSGLVTITSTGKEGEITAEQQEYYEQLSGAAAFDQPNVTMNLVDNDQSVPIAVPSTGTIDVGDVKK